ncbi:carnitine palmitoyltransferase-like protein [Leishmania tarentolae]|uniref:Carnitine palmitoyltransferase-like protein n=1 Tax=Leishmania tarentolae TaxID=5689 RepID=A0A640KH21_LEITA|nr:carnitine palmitoyltransferase-like protein [Leishmania tarentolae]
MQACLPRLCACRETSCATKGHLYASGNWAALRTDVGVLPSVTVQELLTPSLVPTRHYQRSLPKLPLPALHDTLQRYVEAARPLCTPQQLASTGATVAAFLNGEGRHVHEELRRTDKANPHTSYISSDVFEQTLKERKALPLYSHKTWLVRPDPEKQDMLVRSAYWLWASVHFYKLYRDNQLYPEVRYAVDRMDLERSGYWASEWFQRTVALLPDYASTPFAYGASLGVVQPLDMSQFDCLFNCSRMPGVLQDEIKPVGYVPDVLVQYRGHQFQITVADADCVPLSIDELYAQLRDIVHSNVAPVSTDVSVFTALPRTEWNGVRTMLLRDVANGKSLETVEESMLVLNLDADDERDVMVDPISLVGVTAKSPSVRGGNRWWDKSLSVSVNSRGDVAVSAEASWGDGVAVRRYINDVYALSRAAHSELLRKDAPAPHGLRQLQWHVPDELVALAQRVTMRVRQERETLDVAAGVLDISTTPTPVVEATVQLAAQLAIFRVHQKQPMNCVQHTDMHCYLRGRSERIPLATRESTAFLLSMCSSDRETQQLACRAALQRYKAEKRSVSRGSSTYSHLLALRLTAERFLGRIPNLYSDPAYSLVTMPALRFEMIETEATYGCGYTIHPLSYHLTCSRTGSTLLYQVTSPPSSSIYAAASSATFAAAFTHACQEVSALLAPG